MADAMNPDPEMAVQTFPVAPRLTQTDRPTPYVGPGIGDYRKAYAKTVGPGSDEWWAKVRALRRAIDLRSVRRNSRSPPSQFLLFL